MSYTIPLDPLPSQVVSFILNTNDICKVFIYYTRYGLFIDVWWNNEVIVTGVLCENYNKIVRDQYLGFPGDLCFYDGQGTDDPVYTGLGSRFALIYMTPDEVTY
jgi:hypothetical protein